MQTWTHTFAKNGSEKKNQNERNRRTQPKIKDQRNTYIPPHVRSVTLYVIQTLFLPKPAAKHFKFIM